MHFSLAIFVVHLLIAHGQRCTVVLPNGIQKNSSPVYISTGTGGTTPQLFKPSGETTPVSNGDTLQALCSDGGNSFAVPAVSQTSLPVTCQAANSKIFANNLATYQCKSRPKSEIMQTTRTCPGGGLIKEIGFNGPAGFLPVIEYCYNGNTLLNSYSHHTINGPAIGYKQNIARSGSDYRKDEFNVAGLDYNVKSVQLQRFNALYGPGQTYVDGNQKYIAFGHYAPYADFVLGYEQDATNFYVNGAPQFQAINNGNWKALETMTRNLAIQSKRDLDIYTGPIGQLSLPIVGSTQTANAEFGNIKMPEAYFKVVRNASTTTAIVFITLNNPYASTTDVRNFCENSCPRKLPPLPGQTNSLDNACLLDCPWDWSQSKYVTISKGYTLCCTLPSFSRVYNNLPVSYAIGSLYIPARFYN